MAGRGGGRRVLARSRAFGRCLGIAGHPVDAPMWFLRDIIIYTAAAPLLYRLGDYLLWAGMVMLSRTILRWIWRIMIIPSPTAWDFSCWECMFPGIPSRS